LIEIGDDGIKAEIHRTSYDVMAAANAVSARGLPGDVYRRRNHSHGKVGSMSTEAPGRRQACRGHGMGVLTPLGKRRPDDLGWARGRASRADRPGSPSSTRRA